MNPSKLMELDPVSGVTRPFLEHEILKWANPYALFSPDGTRVLFNAPRSYDSKFGSLYLYDRQSMHEIPGTEGGRLARWSSDGSWIIFARDAGRFLFIINPDGSGLRHVLTVPEPEGIQFFALSPDDRFVVYAKYRGLSIAPGLWLVSLDGSVHRALDWNMKATIARVEWSPDGRNLAVGVRTGSSEFWVMENFQPVTQ
jgi:Tol biopolymer transport system component